MNIDDCFLLGKITKPHGYKGDVILYIDADQPELYSEIDCVFLEIKGRLVPHFLDAVKKHSSVNKLIVQFDGVDNEATAKGLGGTNVFLPLKMLPTLDESEFYLHEVQGWTAVNAESKERLGVIRKVLDYAMYPILEVNDEGNNEGKEILIPLPPEIHIHVNRKDKALEVSIPDGLLEVYLGEQQEPTDSLWDGDDRDAAAADGDEKN